MVCAVSVICIPAFRYIFTPDRFLKPVRCKRYHYNQG